MIRFELVFACDSKNRFTPRLKEHTEHYNT
jgi:hypothetical protein